MNSPDIRILQLRPLRVASIIGSGAKPETDGWHALITWARAHDYLNVAPKPRFFGYDVNKATGEHLYCVMMTVGLHVQSDKIVKVTEIPGGLYAVARVQGTKNIPDAWIALEEWVKHSHSFRISSHQCLEEHLHFIDREEEDFEVELMLPIEPIPEAIHG